MKNTYVIITGAGEGLGCSLAVECASRGYNLLLIDLPFKKMDRLAWHLSKSFGVQVRYLEMDLCEENCANEVVRFITEKNLVVSMLINNAGIGHSLCFEKLTPIHIERLLQLNIAAVTRLTYALIPLLKQQPRSHIINLSSLASFYYMPLKNIYAASKAYIRSFSLSLRAELLPFGIHVSVVCPAGHHTWCIHKNNLLFRHVHSSLYTHHTC
jgi:uncharacterized protein